MLNASVWVGWDPREAAAFAVAKDTCRKYTNIPIPIYGLLLEDLQRLGLYTRPIEYRPSAADKPIMWDVVSDAPMSTQHACARFWVPLLAKTGWALFVDGDVMFRGNVARLFEQLDPSKAVYCVQHKHDPVGGTKMDSQIQTTYSRKNWSSVLCFNADHAANKALTLEFLNKTPGRDLHAFCWLKDSEIGELPQAWNVLVGHTDPAISATIAHFTSGTPDMPGYEDQPYADEWRTRRNDWARGPLSFGS
jgi:lipopolysaccharide biosynthesis glycosyltransferase